MAADGAKPAAIEALSANRDLRRLDASKLNAVLKGANLIRADFTGANTEGADFEGALLEGVEGLHQ